MTRIRHLFPGGNTCNGFHSFYDFIVPNQARLKLVLKGGPGVGKSTLMKKLGEDFINLGYGVEFHWCSSDNESLDAIVLPDYDIAVIDGTAPHVVDPRFPGAVDEIVNLGDFWDKEHLRANREEIIAATSLNSRYFALAYNRLREAKVVYDEWVTYFEEALDHQALNRIISDLSKKLLKKYEKDRPTAQSNPAYRRLFAAAITPQGIVNHIASLVENEYELHLLKGSPGTGAEKVLAAIGRAAEYSGLATECYHHPFIPEHVHALVFPEIALAMVDDSPWLAQAELFWPNHQAPQTIYLNELLNTSKLAPFQPDIEDCEQRFRSCLTKAVTYLSQAKTVHDLLETCYTSAMNFDELEAKREELKQSILTYIRNYQ